MRNVLLRTAVVALAIALAGCASRRRGGCCPDEVGVCQPPPGFIRIFNKTKSPIVLTPRDTVVLVINHDPGGGVQQHRHGDSTVANATDTLQRSPPLSDIPGTPAQTIGSTIVGGYSYAQDSFADLAIQPSGLLNVHDTEEIDLQIRVKVSNAVTVSIPVTINFTTAGLGDFTDSILVVVSEAPAGVQTRYTATCYAAYKTSPASTHFLWAEKTSSIVH